MSWERGHLARIGPKARKAPTGATHPSHPLPRPRRGYGSDGVSRKRRRPVRLMWRASGPLAGGTPALPEGPGSDVLGARASCPHRAEGPQGATGATHPSRPLPRPRHGPGSDGVSRKRRRPVRLPMWRACGPLRAGRPRSQGRHPSATRRLCAAGPFQALGEEVDGPVSGTCSCTSAGHVLVARHPLLPRRRWVGGLRARPRHEGGVVRGHP